MSGIEVDKRCDIFPSAVIINSVSVVCGIQKEFFNLEFRKIRFHGEKGMQEGKQHAGRESWFRAKNRVTFPHDRIRLGKIEIPELHDIIPSAFWKHKGIRVKFKELGYESILKGGMTARVTR